ncbi:MAG: DUF11 domain-containing protein [Candidatus Kerfeldbacteria bacterium]|nr:DUF11 domain-containing protein [Candidatus Kerfeldbacteria bacterium]
MSISINLLPRKTVRERVWKTLNVMVGLTMLMNVSMVGALVAPQAAQAAVAGNPSADLDQCANDPAPSPSSDGCNDATATPDQWVNGNLGESKSVYYEGDSIPYRMRFDNLTLGSHTITFEWDTTKSDKHAIDYLTTFNRTVATADPCLDVTGCGSPTTYAIPVDSQVSGAGVTPVAGNFTLYGGTITALSPYSEGLGFPTGDNSRRITVTFTATQANPVLAWGGHIATRSDWGANESAVAISGSPYHTRLIGLDGSGGNQDRSLSAAAVIYPGSITVIKDAVPNSTQDFNFTTTGGLSPVSFSLDDDADGTLSNTKLYSGVIDFKTYTVTESAQAGWTLSNLTCGVTSPNGGLQTVNGATATINLAEGENVTCTYTNGAPVLTQAKSVVNLTHPGATTTANPAQPGDVLRYTLSVQNTGTVDQTNYVITDDLTDVVDYTNAPFNITNSGTYDGTTKFITWPATTITHGTTVTRKFDVTVKPLAQWPNGGDFDLTNFYGNEIKLGLCNLVLTKSVDKATANPGETLTYTIHYQNTGTANCTGGGVRLDDVVPAGTTYVNGSNTQTNSQGDAIHFGYAEAGLFGPDNASGYNPATKLLSWDAETVVPGETGTVTYQATVNTPTQCGQYDIPNDAKIYADQIPNGVVSNTVHTSVTTLCNGTVTVIKHVINDDGGTKTASQFTIHVSNGTPSSFNGSEAGTPVTVLAGQSFNVTEDPDSGYTTSFSGDCAATMTAGANLTCTVTNNDKPGTLTVIKHVINDDGGTKVASNFTMNVTGTNVSDPSFPGDESGTTVTLNAGAYSADEIALSGYAKTIGANCSGTIANGETKTCTITNNDIQPKLTVTKVVINDNGGTKVISDFPLFVDQTGVVSGVQNGFSAGDYTVSETNLPGYVATITGDCTANGAVTLAVGDVKSCTITNNDEAAHLTVIKHVINDNGGTKVAGDFTMSVAGSNVSNPSFAGSEAGTIVTLDAGAYSADETSLAGYAKTLGANCSGTIANGESKTCTITNDDVAPQLTVIKHVINNYGGTAVASNFTMNVNATNVAPSASFPGNELGTTVTLNQGAYDVTEDYFPGYTPSYSTDCVGTIAVGESKVCVVSNTAQAPHLIVVKHVINDNGGAALADAFTMNVTGGNVSTPSFPGSEIGTTVTLDQGAYSVDEGSHVGYLKTSSADCSGTIALGETKICVITNDDLPATITVIKHVVNDNSGTMVASNFTMHLNGTAIVTSFPGNESGTTVNVVPGSYVASETGPSGYDASFLGDCQGSIALGEHKTCTITNNDIQPKLTVTKVVINDNGGTKVISDFPLFVDQTGVVSGVQNGFDAGAYTVSETNLPGYAATISGDCAANGAVTLAVGDVKSCTITNNDIQPKLTVTKVVINDNGGTKVISDFPLFVDQTGVVSGVQNGFDAGSYVVSETNLPGYTSSISGDCDANGNVSLSVGDVKSCTITNDDIQPKLTVTKVVINDNGGNKQISDFPLYVDQTLVVSGVQNGFDADTYTVSENNQFGYTATISGDCATNGSVTLGIGDVKSCTITNDDIAPTITLNKVVINNNGGTASINDFGLTIGGTAVTSGQTLAVQANTPIALNEAGKAGYAFVSITDDLAEQEDRQQLCPDVLNGTVSLAPGQHISCTITNDDIQPKLTVTKVVINDNGGTKVVSDFPLFVNQTGVVSGVQNGFNAGAYTVSETNLPGYAATISGDCAANGAVTLAVGDVKSCTITNNDIIPILGITKTNDIVGFTNPGKQVNYTITVTNAANATDTAKNVVMNDTLPVGFTFVDTGLATKSTNVGDLAPGASKSFTFLVNISGTQAAGIYTNTATAQGSNTLLVTATSNVDVRVPSVLGITAEPELVLTKTVDRSIANPGNIVTYTVTISNPGDADVTNVTLTDTLPTGFTFLDTGKGTKTWTIGTLKAHHQRVLNYQVKLSDSLKAGKYDNKAVVLSAELDPRTAFATVEVRVPQVLGLATTGVSMRDYVIFALGLSLMGLGLYWVARQRRNHGSVNA